MTLVLQGNKIKKKKKKMEKVVIEEFDCFHSFIESCVLNGNFSLMVLLLPLEKSSKNMSSLHLTLYEFKENLSIPHAIIDRKLKKKNFLLLFTVGKMTLM